MIKITKLYWQRLMNLDCFDYRTYDRVSSFCLKQVEMLFLIAFNQEQTWHNSKKTLQHNSREMFQHNSWKKVWLSVTLTFPIWLYWSLKHPIRTFVLIHEWSDHNQYDLIYPRSPPRGRRKLFIPKTAGNAHQ